MKIEEKINKRVEEILDEYIEWDLEDGTVDTGSIKEAIKKALQENIIK